MRSNQVGCVRVCAVRWRKAQRKAYPSEETLIQEFVISNYAIDSPSVDRQEYAWHAAGHYANFARATLNVLLRFQARAFCELQ